MQRLTLLACCLLSGCADFNRGFMASYDRVNSAPLYISDTPAPQPQPIQSGTIVDFTGPPTKEEAIRKAELRGLTPSKLSEPERKW